LQHNIGKPFEGMILRENRMINTACPQCGKTRQFEDSRLGTQEKCSQCSFLFTVSRQAGQSAPPPFPPQYPPTAMPPYPPPGYPPPGYPPGYYYPPPPQPTNGNAIAALVLGIASIWMCVFGFILGPLAIHFAGKAAREIGDANVGGKGLANAGRICGIIGTVLSVAIILFYAAIIIFAIVMSANAPHAHYPVR
jgi:hypothetical protein